MFRFLKKDGQDRIVYFVSFFARAQKRSTKNTNNTNIEAVWKLREECEERPGKTPKVTKHDDRGAPAERADPGGCVD